MSDNTVLDRLNTVANQMRGILSDVNDADDVRIAAAEASNAASGEAVNARELTMIKLADLSLKNNLELHEIGAVLRIVKTGNAQTPKAIETFMGEAAHAMHPAVRKYVPGIVALRTNAWDLERANFEAGGKDTPQPIKLAFSRKYHLLITMFTEAKVGKYLRTVQDVIEFCEGRNPLLNAETQAKRVQKAVAELMAVYAHFADDDLKSAADVLAQVTKETLAASRRVAARPAPAPVVMDDTAPDAPDVQTIQVEKVAEATATVVGEPKSHDEVVDDLLNGEGGV